MPKPTVFNFDENSSDIQIPENITNFMKICKIGSLIDVIDMYELSLLNDVDSRGNTALFYAAFGKNLNVIEYLLDFNLSDLNHRNFDGKNIAYYLSEIESFTLLERVIMNRKFIQNPLILVYDDVKRLYPPVFKNSLSYSLKRIIFEDDIDAFKLNFIAYEFDALLVACSYNSDKIANFCIDENFGTNYISNVRTTPFTYISYYNNVELAKKFLSRHQNNRAYISTKDYLNETSMSYSDKSFGEITSLILSMKTNENIYDNDFRLFVRDDFEKIKYESTSSGSYANVEHVVDKKTGINMIIKKYKECNDEVLDFSTGNEIALIRHLNKVNPYVTTKLYGVYFENRCLHLVQEYLTYTLDEVFVIIKKLPFEEMKTNFKQLLLNLLTNINIINSIGINHNDIKDNNIMMDDNGRLRIIDVGISEYYGLMPYRDFINYSMMTEYIKPPDADNESFFYKQEIHRTKTLNSDVYSVGAIVMNFIKKSGYEKYIYLGDTFFNIEDAENMKTITKFGLNRFDPFLTDLLTKMLESDPNKRFYAKECLKHEYFTGVTYERLFKNVEMTRLPGLKNYARYLKYGNELIYLEEIQNASKNFTLTRCVRSSTNKNELIMINWMLSELFLKYGTFEVAINIIPKLIKMFSSYSSGGNYLSCFIICYFYLAKQLTYPNNFTYDDIFDITERAYTENDVHSIIKKIISYPESLEIIPITTHITYLIVTLQMNNVDAIIITQVETEIMKGLLKWVIFNRGEQIPIWDLILCIYYLLPEHLNDTKIEEKNVELCERISLVISKECDEIKQKHIDKLARFI